MFNLLVIAWVLAGVFSLPLIVLGMECLLALLSARALRGGERRALAVLVPAHNEQAGIEVTLEAIQAQLAQGDRLVVVADNCQDETAALARKLGAEVVERQDDVRRGKGYALDAGVRYLEQHPPEAVLIFDADCCPDPGLIDSLARSADRSGRPVQAVYLMQPGPNAGASSAVSSFAFLIKNWVRPRALNRVGLPVLLTGTGMAFPWKVIREAPLASGEIVEDLALGLELASQGLGPELCEQAKVWSVLPQDAQAAESQRTRWEHGYLGNMLHFTPQLLGSACRGRLTLLPVAVDLMVPPLSLLAMSSTLATAVVGLICLFADAWWPLVWLLSAGGFAALGLCLAWWRFARDLVPARAWLSIPAYALGKLKIYMRFLSQRETRWVRTPRDSENGDTL